MTEKELQKSFTTFLKKENYLYVKNHGGAFFTPVDFKKIKPTNYGTFTGEFRIKKGQVGLPDIVVFDENGKTLFIELKSDIGKLTDTQVATKLKIERLKYKNYYVLRPRSWERFKHNYKISKILCEKTPLKNNLDKIETEKENEN